MEIRINRLTSAGLPKRLPGATNPPNAAEGKARKQSERVISRRKRKAGDYGYINGTKVTPNVAWTGPGGPDEVQS